MNLLPQQKKAFITALIYTALIGIGMFTSYHINGVSYESPNMIKTLVWFEIIMTALAFFMAKKYFSWQELGFGKFNVKNILWLVPMFIVGTIMLLYLVFFTIDNADNITNKQWQLFYLVGFTTLLVGISEELVYRGIVFTSFIKENKVKAVLISSLAFSLLHSVNVLGGLTLSSMLSQMLMTFIAGLFFAFVRMKINNIIPLMLFHWLWDFSLIGRAVIIKPIL